ncbi:MAG: hypothetical protein AAF611_07820 [Bacteroidota bacterium]
MTYYINTTQTPNTLFDNLLKILKDSELRVLLTVIRKTIGHVHPYDNTKRIKRAWISQKLFMICCNLSGRAVSGAIDSLVIKKLLRVTDRKGRELKTKQQRRGTSKLYYSSCLQLETNTNTTSKQAGTNLVTKGHTIKLNNKTKSCYNRSQGIKKLSDIERYQQLHNTYTSKQ